MVACSVERARIEHGRILNGEEASRYSLQGRRGRRSEREVVGRRGRAAVETAAGTLRDLRVAEVTQMDMKLENGKVSAFRTRVSLSFKYEA
jgi:flavin-binding protein dodecin